MMGLSPSELYAMELREFSAAYEGWMHLRQMIMREDMERSRWEAAVIISPHITSRKPLAEMLPLPWDKESKKDVEEIDIEERRRRAAELLNTVRK
jgi:hypothetical protein